MRRKLAYSNPVLVDSIAHVGSLPQGSWHVSKTGGKLFVGTDTWFRLVHMTEKINDGVFGLDKTTSLLIQAQDKTTCRNIAIESLPAYAVFVSGGGGFQASSPRRPRHTDLKAGDRR